MLKRRRIRVVEAVHNPAKGGAIGLNPYTELLLASLPAERVQVRYFSWPTAVLGRYDVLHLHWPEYLVRDESLAKRLLKRALVLLLIVRLSMPRPVVVRTLHNQTPHEPGDRYEAWVVKQIGCRTDAWVTLNESTPTPDPTRTYLVEHGHFRDWYPPVAATSIRGQMLSFGLIRPYKGTERFVEVFSRLPDSTDWRLSIVGMPQTPGLASSLMAIGDGGRVSFDFRYVSDIELATAIAGAEVVVVPYPDLHNSSAALLALSLDRPIILVDSPASRLLEDEFGSEWVARLPVDYAPDDLERVASDLRSRERAQNGPDMSTREWSLLGEKLTSVFDFATGHAHDPRAV